MTSASPNHQTVEVRVWYVDEVRDGMGDWNELPDDGVQAVVQIFADGTKNVLMGNDYYFRAPGENDYIYGANNRDDNAERYEGAVVLKGAWTDTATFVGIERAVFE